MALHHPPPAQRWEPRGKTRGRTPQVSIKGGFKWPLLGAEFGSRAEEKYEDMILTKYEVFLTYILHCGGFDIIGL